MTRSKTLVLAAAAGVALSLAGALAASAAGPADTRREIMKQTGFHMRDAVGFMTGQTPWDAAKVKGLMDKVAANGKQLHGLYPATSAADPKTEAAPNIWKNKPDFDKRLTEMSTLASTAGKAKDVAGFKAAFPALSATCKSCHDIYRKKKA